MSLYAYPGVYREKQISIQDIERLVCDKLGVKNEQIRDKTRRREVCLPRQIIMHFAIKYRKMLPYREGNTIEAIGDAYRLGHATALYAYKTAVPNLIETDRKIAAICKEIDEYIKVLA